VKYAGSTRLHVGDDRFRCKKKIVIQRYTDQHLLPLVNHNIGLVAAGEVQRNRQCIQIG
jgi:hypothetical protein